jgi:hypothetical protein
MKSALLLVLASLSTLTLASHVIVPERRQNSNSSCDPNGWVQNPSGCATFTSAHNCAAPCKHYAYFRVLVVPHGAHAKRDILLQHAA